VVSVVNTETVAAILAGTHAPQNHTVDLTQILGPLITDVLVGMDDHRDQTMTSMLAAASNRATLERR